MAVIMSKPSVLGWRFYECKSCGATYWAEELPDQSRKQTVIEEKFCSEYCKEEWEMLELDRVEQELADRGVSPCVHDWRGVDWGRMCFKCGKEDRA
jgi:hypothetical protein